jgi:uncharacterized protein YjiS (DUF1127 family)
MHTTQLVLTTPRTRALSALARGVGTIIDALRAQRRARRTRTALQDLDPRMLRDIGIDHSDVLVLTTHGTDAVFQTRQRVIHRLDRA